MGLPSSLARVQDLRSASVRCYKLLQGEAGSPPELPRVGAWPKFDLERRPVRRSRAVIIEGKCSLFESTKRALVVGTVVAAGVGIAATPAHAAFDKKVCAVGTFASSCSTGYIPFHSSQHWVRYEVDARGCAADWSVTDTNGWQVGGGHVSINNKAAGTIYNLNGSYKLTITNTCYPTGGIIANYT